jgi:hypothetical protein
LFLSYQVNQFKRQPAQTCSNKQYKRTLTKNLYDKYSRFWLPDTRNRNHANRAGSYVRVWSMDIMKITTKKDYGYNWIRSCHTPSPKTLSLIIGIINSSHGLEMIDNIRSKARRVGLDSYVVWSATDSRRQING